MNKLDNEQSTHVEKDLIDLTIEKTLPPTNVVHSYDVCIIGSGAAGCVLAHKLSHSGKTVVIMEKGNHYTKEWIKQNENNEHDLFNLWKNKGVSLTKYFSANVAQGQCVGGSTIINYGICFPIPDNLFQYWRQTFGITIDKKRLNSAYKKVKEMMGIKTIDPLDAGISHRKLKCGCDMLNYSGNWMDKSYGDDGKHSAYSAYLRNANFDNITLYTNCTADKITTNGNKVTSVTGIIKNECNDINKITVNAKQIIISAGSIASSEILLKNNLSNRNKQVGKHVSIHPAAPIVAIFDENLRQDFEFPMAYYCDEFSILKTGKPGFLIESLCIPLSNYSILMPSFGDENETYVKGYPYSAMAGVLVHDEPNGTVELNWNKDAILDYNLTKIDQRKMIDGMKETARIFLTAGAKKIITGHMEKTEICNMKDIQMIETKGVGLGSLLMASAHPQGGNRMGEDKSLSVVNSNCQSHEFSNLYVCDASVFPTSLGVNPQYTVMALATLTAEHIIEQCG